MSTLFSALAFIGAAFPSVLLWTNKLQLEVEDESCPEDVKAVEQNKLMIKVLITASAVFSALATIF